MGFIQRLKITVFTLHLPASVFCLYLLWIVPSLASAQESTLHEKPDPNTPSVNKAETVSAADPNLPQDSDEEENDFYPRLSTYVAINEAYSNIFTPELITDDGRVDYGTLRRKRHDVVRAAKELKELNPGVLMVLSKNEKIAFWINTYNFCTLKLIIDNYPIEPKLYMIFYPDSSIMQISGNWRTRYFFEIQGFEYTLEEIEWDFLLDRYKDPRIIFALSYASYGGAVLRNEPYQAEILDQQLDEQVKSYLQSPNGMRLDKSNGVIYLSNIFTMHNHEDLFLASEYATIKKFRNRRPAEQAWLNFIWQYLSPEDQRYFEDASPGIRFMKYDWHLNERP